MITPVIYKKNKVVLVGDVLVGKSTLIARAETNSFVKQDPTIGSSFLSYIAHIDSETMIRLCIWDTSGSERYNSFLPLFIKGADVVLICFQRNTPFESIVKYKNYINNLCYNDARIYFVETKIDLLDGFEKTNYNVSQIREYINELKAPYYKTSSLTGEGITELFHDIGKFILENKEDESDIIETVHESKLCCQIL